ncbi:MAG TPA: EVE domain-containing protein, partial [Pyrinomonadaceae bacterium]|nr:EVE domain-containing protein [Pyrinomonadaceae bacterium]
RFLLPRLPRLSRLPRLETMNFWLVKQEPEAYSFDDLIKDGKTDWTGVRNFQARNNLRAMKKGDKVLFYHSVSEKAVVGIAQVSRTEFTDPTDEKWIAVEISPLEKFAKTVSLEQIKAERTLENIALIKQSRLSVMPLTKKEFDTILKLTK